MRGHRDIHFHFREDCYYKDISFYLDYIDLCKAALGSSSVSSAVQSSSVKALLVPGEAERGTGTP